MTSLRSLRITSNKPQQLQKRLISMTWSKEFQRNSCEKFWDKKHHPLLVAGLPTPLKNMKGNRDDDIPDIWENKRHVPNHKLVTIFWYHTWLWILHQDPWPPFVERRPRAGQPFLGPNGCPKMKVRHSWVQDFWKQVIKSCFLHV